jgi:hypothetical protein
MPGDRHGFLTIMDNVLTVDGMLGVQSHLTGLRINQETFQKKLEGVQINLQR